MAPVFPPHTPLQHSSPQPPASQRRPPSARTLESITDSEDDEMSLSTYEDEVRDRRRYRTSEDDGDDEFETAVPPSAPKSTVRPPVAGRSSVAAASSYSRLVTLPGTDTVPEVKDGILCICPARFMKERKRLGTCRQCGIITHFSCVARNASGTRGYLCFFCPGSVLVDEPDRGVGSKSKVSRKDPLRETLLQSGIVKTVMKKKVPGIHQRPVASVATLSAADDIAQESRSRQHNLRRGGQVVSTYSSPVRASRSARPRNDTISARFDELYHGLMRKSDEARTRKQHDPRTTELHKIFLQDIAMPDLWRHYCHMPDGLATNAEVARATELGFVGYLPQPIHPVPEAWAKELKYRLGMLLDTAASDGQKTRLDAKQCERDAGLALRHVRDIAIEVLHHGSYKGKRAKLGLLAEVLGLSEKGAFWKGGTSFGA